MGWNKKLCNFSRKQYWDIATQKITEKHKFCYSKTRVVILSDTQLYNSMQFEWASFLRSCFQFQGVQKYNAMASCGAWQGGRHALLNVKQSKPQRKSIHICTVCIQIELQNEMKYQKKIGFKNWNKKEHRLRSKSWSREPEIKNEWRAAVLRNNLTF